MIKIVPFMGRNDDEWWLEVEWNATMAPSMAREQAAALLEMAEVAERLQKNLAEGGTSE